MATSKRELSKAIVRAEEIKKLGKFAGILVTLEFLLISVGIGVCTFRQSWGWEWGLAAFLFLSLSFFVRAISNVLFTIISIGWAGLGAALGYTFLGGESMFAHIVWAVSLGALTFALSFGMHWAYRECIKI